jgi:hypothetical protein
LNVVFTKVALKNLLDSNVDDPLKNELEKSASPIVHASKFDELLKCKLEKSALLILHIQKFDELLKYELEKST